MPRRRLRLIAFVALLAALAGCTSADEKFTGTRLDPPFEVSSLELSDAHGAAFSITEDIDRELTLVFFGYTHCPDICGQLMSTLAGSMRRLDEAQRDRVQVVFVTTDPMRDTVPVVGAYVESYDPNFIGLTGDLDKIVTVAQSMKVAIGYFDPAGEELAADDLPKTYDVEHGTQIFAVDPAGKATAFWRADVSQAQLTSDLLLLLDEG